MRLKTIKNFFLLLYLLSNRKEKWLSQDKATKLDEGVDIMFGIYKIEKHYSLFQSQNQTIKVIFFEKLVVKLRRSEFSFRDQAW